MKRSVISFLVGLAADVVFGLAASAFAYFILGTIIPEMMSTSIDAFNGAVHFQFLVDAEKMRKIFSIWHNFCILFGIRFVVAYVCGSYRIKDDRRDKEEA